MFQTWIVFTFRFKFQVIGINTCISILTDSDIPVSTIDAHNVGEIEGTEGQDAQSHSVSSPSKAMSISKPIIEENVIEVDSTLH